MGSRKRRDSFTVISNIPLRDPDLSLKAKGLFCVIRSLPDDWEYSLRGLSHICVEGIDAIREGVKELERAGYLHRERSRKSNGKYTTMKYVIHEKPLEPHMAETATVESSEPEKSPSEDSTEDDHPQGTATAADTTLTPSALTGARQSKKDRSNTDQKKKKEKNTYPSSTEVSNPYQSIRGQEKGWSGVPVAQLCEIVKQHISYDIMCQEYDSKRLDEIVALIVEVLCSKADIFNIAGEDYPAELVHNRLLSLNSLHIQYVFECLNKNTKAIYNIKTYLLATLFNAPATISNYYDARVRYDFSH